ncbi:hypothetical protein RRG08_047986 [Elysia crispata]|uniref:Uncharacterized protein n=1 Tax=Elysia crispata TaxID=231223 RepID=A0AAE1DND3_9GAST|nr:hypothetical protein RRG08_047986 [Elysia crispata]
MELDMCCSNGSRGYEDMKSSFVNTAQPQQLVADLKDPITAANSEQNHPRVSLSVGRLISQDALERHATAQ